MGMNINLSSLGNAEVLKKRIFFTLLALIVFRLGSFLPIPGIDPLAMNKISEANASGILGIFDKFTGGALGRMTVFALGVMPYISASIITQLLTSVLPHFESLKKEGAAGKKKLNQYTRYLTVLLATVQGSFIISTLKNMDQSPVINPNFLFTVSGVVTLLAGTLFLMWLGEQITSRGIGNGVSIIIFSGIVANLPRALITTLELGRSGTLSPFLIFSLFLFLMAALYFIVFIERSQRRIQIQYPQRQLNASKMTGSQGTHLPLKINSSGVIPPIFANSLMLIPISIVNFVGNQNFDSPIVSQLMLMLSPQGYLFAALSAVLIIFFSFFYTSIVFNPDETAENLKKGGAIVPGYRPGQNTSAFFDYTLTRLTVVGSLYLVVICVIPDIFIRNFSIPLYLSGTSLLIVVSVGIDIITHIQTHMYAYQYQNLVKKAKKTKGPVR